MSQPHDLRNEPNRAAEEVVPVLSEELVVEKDASPTGSVRVHRLVQDHDELVDVGLRKEHVDVRRVVMNQYVDGPLPIRREGDTTIIPVVEEVIVVEKRYRLKEEVHVTRIAREERHEERVTVSRQDAWIEELDSTGSTVQVQPPAPDPPSLQPPTPVADKPAVKKTKSIFSEWQK